MLLCYSPIYGLFEPSFVYSDEDSCQNVGNLLEEIYTFASRLWVCDSLLFLKSICELKSYLIQFTRQLLVLFCKQDSLPLVLLLVLCLELFPLVLAAGNTHRLLNLWHSINLHLFPNHNSQLQIQSWVLTLSFQHWVLTQSFKNGDICRDFGFVESFFRVPAS